MSTFASDTFDAQGYAAGRPTYPPQLYTEIISQLQFIRVRERSARNPPTVLLDLGCGPGLATSKLGVSFTKAIGIDPSPVMIDAARKLASERSDWEKMEFVVACAEDLSKFGDKSIDFVVAGQAAHWFDLPKVYRELRRVLKPCGTFAFWSYDEPFFPSNQDLSDAISHFTNDTLGAYWQQPGRSHLKNLLDTLPFPSNRPSALESADYIRYHGHFGSFTRERYESLNLNRRTEDTVNKKYEYNADGGGITEFRNLPLLLMADWTYDDLEKFLRTWSAVNSYDKEHYPDGETSVVDLFRETLLSRPNRAFVEGGGKLPIAWKLGMMKGQKS